MPTEVKEPQECLEVRLLDRLAHCEQYLAEALKIVREAREMLGVPPDDDERLRELTARINKLSDDLEAA